MLLSAGAVVFPENNAHVKAYCWLIEMVGDIVETGILDIIWLILYK